MVDHAIGTAYLARMIADHARTSADEVLRTSLTVADTRAPAVVWAAGG